MANRLSVLLCFLLLAACRPSTQPCARGPDSSASAIRFVAVGDTGRGNDGQFAVAAAIASKCATSGCDFGVLLGDNIYPTGVDSPTDEQFEEKFVLPYGDLGFPFYVSLGNHDYGAGGAGSEFDKGAHQVAYSERNPQWILPAECYSFSTGVARFIALGTNLLLWDHADALSTHGSFVRQELHSAGEPWRIAFGHHPYRSNGQHGNAGAYDGVEWPPEESGEHVKDFVEQNLCGSVDVYLAGHDHDRQVIPPTEACRTHLIVSGAGAATRPVAGGPNRAFFSSATLGFTWLEITDAQIRIEMVDVNGATDYAQPIRVP